MAEQKRLLRTWVAEVKLAPEQQQVEMTFRIPEPIMNGVVAGAVFVPDSYCDRQPLVAVHWVYVPVKQGGREMRRIGLAA